MNTPKTETTVRHSKGGCCEDTECGPGVRNNYFLGKRLTPDSFSVEQRYELNRRHLLNRAIHGWGVVYGYGVERSSSGEKLKITAGLALDECGRELLHSETWLKINSDLLVFNAENEKIRPEDREKAFEDAGEDACWMLRVHYAEQSVGAVKVDDSCYCDHQRWDRICETVRFSLTKLESCDECCKASECDLKCECGSCCDDSDDGDDKYEQLDRYILPDPQQREAISVFEEWNPDLEREGERENADRLKGRKGRTHKRGGCRCLCDHLTGLDFSDKCGARLCTIKEECGTVEVDLKNGVPLACVNVGWGDCGWSFSEEIEDCGPRRLVKRNDLLFDLIRGCDLTYIERIGWERWHRGSPMSLKDFSDLFGTIRDSDGNIITQAFKVKFSGDVRSETVQADCFVLTGHVEEPHDCWRKTLQVPIVDVHKEPGELINSATIIVDRRWGADLRACADPTDPSSGILVGKRTIFELEVRGDYILDCNGQAVDANPRGLSPTPTGNGTPGGTYLSTFVVDDRPPSPAETTYREDRIKGASS